MTENQKINNGTQKEKSKEVLEKEEEQRLKNESLKKAGKIAQEVKKFLKPEIKVGAKALDIITSTEIKIEELGGFCAFPVNFCINHIAAHYTSPFRDDGLIIKSGFSSGLLLPQVFVEYESTPKQALEMTCQKAGLDNGAWKDPDNKIYTFSAQIFEEKEPYGDIVEKKIL